MKAKHKKLLWITGCIILIAAIGLLVLINSISQGYNDGEENQLKFSKDKWGVIKNDSQENPRHYMLTDLKKNYLKNGIDSMDVKKILGEPDSRRFGFAYNMGIYQSPFDPTFLILEFDKNGKLVKASEQTI